MIEVKNLTKTYGKSNAVDDVSFVVKSGEILGFLGPNGAGKTTTMNIITGYISATKGQVLIDGHDIMDEPILCKSKIGYLPELPPLYMNMTVNEYLSFVYDIKKVKSIKDITETKAEHIKKITELVKIDVVAKRLIKNLSKGYKQRVGIAQALVGNPEILILDEPTVGLDPKQILEVRNVIRELGQNRTVIVSSHILSEISAICERVIIINKGRVLAEDTPDRLSKKMEGHSKFVVRVEGDSNTVERELKKIPGVLDCTYSANKEENSCDFIIEADAGKDIRKDVFKSLAQKDMAILMFNPLERSLEDIFIELTEKNISLVDDVQDKTNDSAEFAIELTGATDNIDTVETIKEDEE